MIQKNYRKFMECLLWPNTNCKHWLLDEVYHGVYVMLRKKLYIYIWKKLQYAYLAP